MAAPWRRHKGISSVPKKRCATTWGKVGWGAGQLNNSNRCDLLIFIEGSLEVKLLEKQRWEESEKRKAKERSSEKRKNQKKEDAGAQKTRKVAKHRVFSNVLWLRQVHEELHTSVARSRFGSQNATNTSASERPLGLDVEKVHTPVAPSAFPNQNGQSTPFSEHFWKLRSPKRARCCGAKHISK